jgi:hypothetical protein
MGIATWFASAAVALAIARTAPLSRPLSLPMEVLLTSVAACCYGLVATALDFGGWNEPDWRAAIFAFLGAATCLPLVRAASIRRASRSAGKSG